MDQRVRIDIDDFGLSMINDISLKEMVYINLRKTKVIRTETKIDPHLYIVHEIMAYEAMGFFVLNVKFIVLLTVLILFFSFDIIEIKRKEICNIR